MTSDDAPEQSRLNERFHSLFTQLFVAMLLLAILPLCFVIVSEYQQGRKSILDNQHVQLEEVSRQVSSHLNLYLDGVSRSLEVESGSVRDMLFHLQESRAAYEGGDVPFVESFSYQLIAGQYRSAFERYTDTYQLEGMAIADKEGNVLFGLGTESMLLGENLLFDRTSMTELTDAFEKVLNGSKRVLTAPEKHEKHNAEGKAAHSRLVVGVYDESDTITGILYAVISPEKLTRFFQFGEHYSGIRAYLLTEEGIIQYGTDIRQHQSMTVRSKHPEAEDVSTGVDDHDHHVHDHGHEDLVFQYNNFAGRTVFGDAHSVNLQGTVMRVLVEMELANALTPINAFRDRLLKTIFLTFLVVLLMSWLITRKVVSPLGRLSRRVMKVREGNYDQKQIIDQYKEIKILSQNIEYMTSEIKKLLDENKERNWYQQGLVQLNDAIRGNFQVKDLTTTILTSLVRYMDFKVAAFYLSDDSGHLNLSATYAAPAKPLAESIAFGEGVTGQVAVDQQIREVNYNAQHGLIINSASGSTEPETVINVPVVHNDQTLGVLVFGQFQPMTSRQSRFIQKCSTTIAMALLSALQREALTSREVN